MISSHTAQQVALNNTDVYPKKITACFNSLSVLKKGGMLISLLLALILCSGCQPWQDPTQNLADRSSSALEKLKQTEYQLNSLSDLPVRQQLDSLLVWTKLLKDNGEEAALVYAREATQIANSSKFSEYQAQGRYYLALLEGRQQLFWEKMADPIVNATISKQLWEETDNVYWQACIYHLFGDLYYGANHLDSSHYYFQLGFDKLSRLEEKTTDYYSLLGSLYYGEGILAYAENDLPLADSLYQLASVNYDKAKDDKAIFSLNEAVAMLHIKQSELDSATYLLNLNVEQATLKDNIYDLTNAYQRLGNLYLSQYRDNADLTYFHLSQEQFQNSLAVQKDNYYYTYRRMGRLMQSRANRDENRPDYVDSALVYYNLALIKAREEGALDYFRGISKNVTSLCNWLQDEEGRDCFEILGTTPINFFNDNYTGVVDTITEDLAEANNNYFSFKEQFQAIKNEQRIKNLRYLSLGGLLVTGLLFLFLFQRQKNKRLAARMEALRAQINPHFFSNSLNAIESLVNLDQRKAASKYLIHFSRLTRRILNSSLEATTTLAGELETTRHFLMLEQLRFKDKLHFEFDIAEDLAPKLIEVPALIFQPYLENSIWHGIKPKTTPSTLSVKVYHEGKTLICEIEDDGIGREAAAMQQANSLLQQKSVGMKITRERLSQFGGGKVNVVDLFDEEGNASGTRVVLRLPYRKK